MKFTSYLIAVFGFYILRMWRKPIHKEAYWALFNRAKRLKNIRNYERKFLLKYLRIVKIKQDE